MSSPRRPRMFRVDEWIVQVQQRAGGATFQGSYTLAWARGFGGCIGGGGGSTVQCQGPVNQDQGEATWNLDARVTKFFDFGASRRLGVFAEIYNITNKTNFGAYNGTATSVLFQQPTAYFAGYPTSRQLQLGARFSF